MKVQEWNVLKMIVFRENMDSVLDVPTARKIFGKEIIRELDPRISQLLVPKLRNDTGEMKIDYLKERLGRLMVFDWVKFIGVTGSIAARTAKEEDDVDLLVVVKNGTAWFYRGLVLVKNLFSGLVRTAEGKNVKNRLCINMIVEERGLTFNSDIFTLHELYYMIPVYRLKYKRMLLGRNPWVSGFGGIIEEKEWEQDSAPWFVALLNKLAMHAQITYMFLLFHKPNLKRILQNYENGKIMFYPGDFKAEMVAKFEQLYEVRVEQIVRNDSY